MVLAKINENNIFAYVSRGSLLLTLLLTLITLLFGTLKFSAGIFVGGLLSTANFYWLRNILQRALKLQPHNAPRFAVLRYLVRLALLAGIIFLLLTSGNIDVFGLLLGLSVIVINIIALSIYLSLKGG